MLDFFAGQAALEWIRENGFKADDVSAITGAAGGPKWLVLSRLDRFLFGHWFQNRKVPLHLAGSSAGAWRFAAAPQSDPSAAVDRFEDAYIQQRYETEPPPWEVTRQAIQILNRLLGAGGEAEILRHPFFRLNVITVRSRRFLTERESRFAQGAGMAAAAFFNALHRRFLGLFFDRVVFHDPRATPPISRRDGLPTRLVPLTLNNLKSALLGSGSIPLVMSGVSSIPDAPPGVYRDGGVIDYHLDLPLRSGKGIVFFPHYTNRMIPGWLDKRLTWRRPRYIDRTLMASPSRAFLERLPYGKIPDREDFRKFLHEDRERIAFWRRAAEMGAQLVDDFWDAVDSGRIRHRVRPFGAGPVVGSR